MKVSVRKRKNRLISKAYMGASDINLTIPLTKTTTTAGAVTICGDTVVQKKFTGKELDRETGLYYYGARYLDPKTSRWISGDPALGDYLPPAPVNEEAKKRNGNLPRQGGVFNLVNFHVYHYAGNNPVKYMDPDGNYFGVKKQSDNFEKYRNKIYNKAKNAKLNRTVQQIQSLAEETDSRHFLRKDVYNDAYDFATKFLDIKDPDSLDNYAKQENERYAKLKDFREKGFKNYQKVREVLKKSEATARKAFDDSKGKPMAERNADADNAGNQVVDDFLKTNIIKDE